MQNGTDILRRALLLDLETAPDETLLKVGAVFGEQVRFLKGRFQRADISSALSAIGAGAEFVLGHNILDHDLPILAKQFPNLALHTLPLIDTLFLSPIAFPENPYHHLVKDYRLLSTAINDPVCDARNAGQLFCDEFKVLAELSMREPDLVRFYAWAFAGIMRPFFRELGVVPFDDAAAVSFFSAQAPKYGCRAGAGLLAQELVALECRESAAYALAWLRVAGGGSVLPPWVRYRFPEVTSWVHRLRNKACGDPACVYCVTHHHPQKQLKRFFGFDAFRPLPAAPDGGSLQEAIVRAGMNDEPLLAILPTGGGKSLCYQLPALVRNQRAGSLTIVISPLQALMKDQVDNLNRMTESSFAAALYGMLTPPERGSVLERVRLGDIAVLYVSPEQLRNVSFRNVIKERAIGCWVFDEAHCLSRWGHSFRPDYLYAARFIREHADSQKVICPPVACFTATAKCDVIEEIRAHFMKELSQSLLLFPGGAERENLDFEVQMVSAAEKRDRVLGLLRDRLPQKEDGASVVYCATRSATEDMARWLAQAGLSAEAFHAGLTAPEKRRILEEFIAGKIQHICATNAFGMGIDKENVRLVVHADIPGSLENYLQEAGRAGRDRQRAHCVLLYDDHDIETQFSMSAFSRLTRHDIAQILRGLRRAKRDEDGRVTITAGEILRDEDVDTNFNTADPMATTKVNTAVSMLERGGFVQRNENRTNVLQVQPLVRSAEEAMEKIGALSLSQRTQRQWLEILQVIFNSDPDEGLSADELAELPSMRVEEEPAQYQTLRNDTLPVMRILNDMVNARIVEKETLMSAFIKVRCVNPSEKVLAQVCVLEKAMIGLLREEEPDPDGWMVLSLRRLNQRLRDADCESTPELLRSLLVSLSLDGQGLAGHRGSIELKYRDKEHYRIKLQREWSDLLTTAEKRQAVAGIVLAAIAAKIPAGSSGEHLVKFGESDLMEALRSDLFVAAQIKNFSAAIERALLFLHEQRVIILQQGLAVFRSAMTIDILPSAKGRRFTNGDYSSLKEHYLERNFQIHVMNKYARLGLGKIGRALELVLAYFTMGKAEFVRRFFAGEQEMLDRATSAESYQAIVEQLNNGVQAAVVSASPTENMLVLAGPGSGKSRVIAHRCAYLLRVERVRPREVLVVCFNRAAALSLRQRLRDLVGKEAAWVTVQTYHGLAMRLIGASFATHLEDKGEALDLDALIPEATRMLRGDCDIPGVERDEMRDRLLAGYRHILIDEYQDIDQAQYDMISAIAGRTLESSNEDAKLSILAVGDDDQNIYTFRGANVQFIRQFKQDYDARLHYLVENYRSTRNIISAANQVIARNRDRMKTGHSIQINSARKSEADGAPVQIVDCAERLDQARHVVSEIEHVRKSGASVAVFARTKKELHPIRAALESADIPVVLAAESRQGLPRHRLREVRGLVGMIKNLEQKTVTATRLQNEFCALPFYDALNPWCEMVDALLREWELSTGNRDRHPDEIIDFIYESLHESRMDSDAKGGVYLATVHAAKGLEFDHVILLGEGWRNDEEERRTYYVGMTRARQTLTLCNLAGIPNPHTEILAGRCVMRCQAARIDRPTDEALQLRYELLGPSSIWLDYPVIAPNAAYVRQEVATLRPGSPVELVCSDGGTRVFIVNAAGHKMGALSQAASQKWCARLASIKSVRVYAVIVRVREADRPGSPAEWEIPLLEFCC